MLEFFRRHRGPFMIGITVVIIITFAWWGGSRKAGGGHDSVDATLLEVYGNSYTREDLARYQGFQRLCYQLGLYELAFGLPAAAQLSAVNRDDNSPVGFAANLIVLRNEALKHGVEFTDEEAMAKIKTLQPFQKEGKLDEERLANFQSNIGAMGMTIRDVLDIVKDSMAYDKLTEMVGANYTPSAIAVDKSYAAQQQTLKISTVKFALDDFKKKVEVKDDEVAKYYGEKKENYMTAEKRAAVYVLFEKPKADDKKKAEENVAATTAWETMVNKFDSDFNSPGADINKLVEALKNPAIKVQSIALFEQATPSEALKEEADVVKELFRPSLHIGEHSAPIEGKKGYYFLTITQVEASKQQELKEVTAKVKETLITQKAQEAMTKAANDARTALQDALKAGKKLDDIAKEKGWKTEALADMSPSNPPPGLDKGTEIAKSAAETPVNGVALPISTDTGSLLVVVTGKELRKSDTSASMKTSQESSITQQTKSALFKSWFSQLVKDADVQQPTLISRS
jgi:SurA N-terminal domain/PPIC-type PPIASE domain